MTSPASTSSSPASCPESPRNPVQAIVNAGTGRSPHLQGRRRGAHGRPTAPAQSSSSPFPGDLKDRYQHFTEADLSGLRAAGYTDPFTSVEEGVRKTFAPI